MKKLPLLGGLVMGIILCAALYAAELKLQNRFIVVNGSGQVIEELSVEVCDREYSFADIPANGEVWSKYRISGDCSFSVSGELADGAKINTGGGYVTSGMWGRRDRISIAPGGQGSVR